MPAPPITDAIDEMTLTRGEAGTSRDLVAQQDRRDEIVDENPARNKARL
jgi:hypothetical protein